MLVKKNLYANSNVVYAHILLYKFVRELFPLYYISLPIDGHIHTRKHSKRAAVRAQGQFLMGTHENESRSLKKT